MKLDTLVVKVGYESFAFVGLSGQEIAQLSNLLGKLKATDDRWDGSTYLPVVLADKTTTISMVDSKTLLTVEEFDARVAAAKAAKEAEDLLRSI